jgi:hypothetical protein
MFRSGERVDVGQFSRELVGEMIDDYVANATIMTNRRWTQLMDTCGVQDPDNLNHRPVPGSSSMQQKRHTLYVPSSPMKEE